MSKRCIGDSVVVCEYPYDSVRLSRKRAIEMVSVLCLADDVRVIDWPKARVTHARVSGDWCCGLETYLIEMSRWSVGTLLHEIAHINAWEMHHEAWGHHDRRFKREQERLYGMYNAYCVVMYGGGGTG